VSMNDWYNFSQTKLVDGYDVNKQSRDITLLLMLKPRKCPFARLKF